MGGPAEKLREDGHHGLTAVPSGMNKIGSGVWTKDDGGVTDILEPH